MRLYIVACSFKPTRKSKWINGIAIANNPNNDVVTFIKPNGKAYTGKSVWSYEMAPYEGCTAYEVGR
jgi:hypothetical protein